MKMMTPGIIRKPPMNKTLTNPQLSAAIEEGYKMLRASNMFNEDWPPLLKHLELLLKEQQKRAN
jgi:hypothetical protein